VQGGLTEVGDNQYYVNQETHKIEKNTEVNIDSTLYTTDDKGDLQKKEIPGQKSTDETKSTESGDGKTSGDSGTSEGNQGADGSGTSDDTEEPDRDAGYVPVNEEETNRQEPAPAGGRIRYSDDYWSGDAAYNAGNYDDGRRESEQPSGENDNPASGMLLWRDGKWTEIHGSAEKPIEIHIYGRDAAVMDRGFILRDAVLCSSEGVYGFDQYGNALPAGPAARYGKQFYITAPDPYAEILVLMMS
jgi:hypothetical protein